MQNLTQVDIILAAYNGGTFLREQIESILAQQGVNVRIKIFDDHSTDDTLSIAKSYLDSGKVSVLSQPRQTGGAFQNFRSAVLSCEISDCDYYAFCDQDDIWEQDKLLRQIEAIHVADASGCSTSVLAFSHGPRASARVIDNSGKQTSWDFYFEGGGQGCTYVFKPQLMMSLRDFLTASDVVLPHDWSLYAYCRCVGQPWVILSEPLVRYRQHTSNAFGARGSWAGRWRRLQMLLAGDFRQRRISLCATLAKVPDSKAPVPRALTNGSFGMRLIFALPKALKLRRFKGHSLVIAMFFILGFA